MMHRATPALLCALLVVGAPHTARAQGDPVGGEPGTTAGPGDTERAVELGREGIALFEKGSWAEALDAFSEADRLYHSPVFALYAARCAAHLDRLLEARRRYQAIADEAPSDSAPPQWNQARIDARAELASIGRQIPTAIVELRGASAQATLEVDGAAVQPGQPIELDPGTHRFVARDAGRDAVVEQLLRRGDAERRIVLTFDAPAASPDSAAVLPTAPRTDVPAPIETAHGGSSIVPGIIVLGVGGASLVVGAITGALALGGASDINERCPDGRCEQSDQLTIEGDQDSTYLLADISTITLIGGAVAATAGVVLIAVASADGTDATITGHPGRVQLRLRF